MKKNAKMASLLMSNCGLFGSDTSPRWRITSRLLNVFATFAIRLDRLITTPLVITEMHQKLSAIFQGIPENFENRELWKTLVHFLAPISVGADSQTMSESVGHFLEWNSFRAGLLDLAIYFTLFCIGYFKETACVESLLHISAPFKSLISSVIWLFPRF